MLFLFSWHFFIYLLFLQPVSVIAPFKQVTNAHSLTSSSSNIPKSPAHTVTTNPPNITNLKENKFIKRNQSFHGFNNTQRHSRLQHVFSFSGNINDANSTSHSSLQSCPSRSFQYLPAHSRKLSGNNSVCEPYSSNVSMNSSLGLNSTYPTNRRVFPVSRSLSISQPVRIPGRQEIPQHNDRISGRNELQFIRRTASGIILPQQQSEPVPQSINLQPQLLNSQPMRPNLNQSGEIKRPEQIVPSVEQSKSIANPKETDQVVKRLRSSHRKLATIAEKRFGSLDLRKHKCYSPTFYSMRCKKHAKKRPIIVALPKKCFSELALSKEPSDKFENLTDSIQIFEEISPETNAKATTPKPAPRCRRHSKEIVYANVNKAINKNKIRSASIERKEQNGTELITKVELHVPNVDLVTVVDETKQTANAKEIKTIILPSKSTPQKPIISSHALKNSPILKVSPNFIKPINESPKGALSLQLQAKIKCSPLQNSPNLSTQFIQNSPNTTVQSNESSPSIVGQIKKPKITDDDVIKTDEHCSNVPSMPLLNPQNMWSPNQTNPNKQVCYFVCCYENIFLRIVLISAE